MTHTAVPADRCPLCGGPNACGLVAGKAACWCFDARVPRTVVDQVPLEARDVACICQTCATPAVSSPAAASGRGDR